MLKLALPDLAEKLGYASVRPEYVKERLESASGR